MANHVSHAALPFPVRGCRFTVGIPYLDPDGDPLDPVTPDTEVSLDGQPYADCTEEVTLIAGNNGSAWLTLTGDELNASLVFLAARAETAGPKTTLLTLQPQVRAVVRSGTAVAGAASSITFDGSATPLDDYYNGCLVKTTGGTGGGGGAGSRDNQARTIVDYDGVTRTAVVFPPWEIAPDATTTYTLLQTELTGQALGTGAHPAVLPSQVDVANLALLKLGDTTIVTFEDDTVHARAVKLVYPRVVDMVLRGHKWRFAIKQAELAQLAGAPTWRWSYRYALPTDPFCLRVTRVSAEEDTVPSRESTSWEIQGRELYTNETRVIIEYVARIADPQQWDALFLEALTERLAAELAIPITSTPSLRMALLQGYGLKVQEARAMDSFEGAPEVVDAYDLLDGR